MNVLHICSFYPSSNLYINLFNELYKKGVKNSVYIPCKPKVITESNNCIKTSTKLIYAPICKNGDNIYEKAVNIFHQYTFCNYNTVVYKNFKKLKEVEKCDIIHAHSLFNDGYLAYKLHKETGKEYIVAVRNTDVNGYFKIAKHLRKLGIEIMKSSKKIIFISYSYKELVLNNYVSKKDLKEIQEKSVVIPNGIDEFWLNNGHIKPKNINKDKIRLIQVGKVDKNKNVNTSIKICEELRNQGINTKLFVVGDGKLLNKLKLQSKNKNYIEFKGKANKEELKKLYDESDIFIMPSQFETFGLVYVEAMTRGLPIIYTRGQGIDQYFEDGVVGFPIVYNDYNEGVKSVKKIMLNYESISTNGLINSKSFSWKLIANQYIDIYQ